MAIQFRDFPPVLMEKNWLGGTSFAPLKDTVQRVNEWIAAKGARIFNVETLLLPNFEVTGKTTDTKTYTADSGYWYQVVRVWYSVDDSTKQV